MVLRDRMHKRGVPDKPSSRSLLLKGCPSVSRRAPTRFEAGTLRFSLMCAGNESAKPQICIVQAFALALCFCPGKSVVGFLLAPVAWGRLRFCTPAARGSAGVGRSLAGIGLPSRQAYLSVKLPITARVTRNGCLKVSPEENLCSFLQTQ